MQDVITFCTAMVPVLELRGALPLGLSLGLSPQRAFLLAVLGNLVPIPFLILLVRQVFHWLRRSPFWQPKVEWLERKAHLQGRMVQKYRLLGLVILVAIPLPGTGAWTGALVAAILEIRLRYALPAILLGVLIAGVLVLGASFGVIHLWS